MCMYSSVQVFGMSFVATGSEYCIGLSLIHSLIFALLDFIAVSLYLSCLMTANNIECPIEGERKPAVARRIWLVYMYWFGFEFGTLLFWSETMVSLCVCVCIFSCSILFQSFFFLVCPHTPDCISWYCSKWLSHFLLFKHQFHFFSLSL